MRRTLLTYCCIVLLIFMSGNLWAQDRKVSGRITSAEDGQPLPAVNVIVKGTGNGTVTDVSGNYTISVPASDAVLSFSFIGFKAQQIPVGDRTTIDLIMEHDAQQLEEVVVSALGIERKQAAIGYASSTASAQDISQGRSFSAVNGLQGKMAGVIINSGSGQPGAQTFVAIRGINSIGGNNNPLYVVDGVPIDNSFNNFTSDANPANRQQDFGNRANDFNPEDIESITVLKSASATTLYGSRGTNGVILITTKKGKINQGVQVTFTSSASFSNPLRIPTTQQKFGQGWNAVNDYTQNGSWGPAFDGKERVWGNVVDNSQKIKPYVPLPSNVRDFYETGTSYINTLGISGGTDKVTYYFSYGNVSENGIIPTDADSYKRNNLSFRGSYTGKRLTISTSINYILKNAKAVTVGQNDNGPTLFKELMQTPSDISLVDMKDYNNKFYNLDNYYTPYNQNPYFVVNENGNKFVENRIQGNINLQYRFTNWLSANWRIGGDVANAQIKDWIAIATFNDDLPNGTYAADIPGKVYNRSRYSREVNSDFVIMADKKLSTDFHLNAFIGHNVNQREHDDYDAYVSNLSVPGFYNLLNSGNPPTVNTLSTLRRLVGVYGQAEINFRDYLYVTLLGRNDWSSTLPKRKNSYFYPGANVSFVFTDFIPSLQNKISFGKLRLSVGQTSRDTDPYRINSVFIPSSVFLDFGELKFPVKGVNAFEVSNQLNNPGLKPEVTTEYEIGADLKFLDKRLGLDVTLYNKITKDQILAVQVASSSGYNTQIRNWGKVQNKGLELLLSVIPVKSKTFIWALSNNWTINRNKVLELSAGLDEALIQNVYNVDFVAIKGQPIGTYKTPQYATDAEGHIIVNSQGLPTSSSSKSVMGNIQPDFIMGITNQFTYKNFSLSFTFDYRQGGKMYSFTRRYMEFVGNSTNTTYNNRQPFIVPNSVKQVGTDENGNVKYAENDIPVSMSNVTKYFNPDTNLALEKDHLLDRTYVKLREVVVTYVVPSNILQRVFIQSLSISLIARNLWLWTPRSNNIIDPEVTAYNGADVSAYLGEFAVGPSVRSIGVSLRAGF